MGARRDFPVDADYAGGRLETFLRRKLGLPRTLALKALRKGWVRVGGKRAKAEQRLESGSVVTVTNPALTLPALEGEGSSPAQPGGDTPRREASGSFSERGAAPRPQAPRRREPSRIPEPVVRRARASIRFEDEALLVSAKPWGEVIHAGTGHASGWVDALRAALAASGAPPAELVPIGRLDRDTSGLLALAKTRAAARVLFDALREGKLARTYLALVSGRLRAERGTIDAPLEKLEREGGYEQVVPSETGKAAVTHWEVARRLGAATLLRVRIETGRTHQIRAHLASIGHALLGDPRQRGTTGVTGQLARRAGLGRLFLHAAELELPHPTTGEVRRFVEPLPDELARAVERLGGG